MIKYFIIWLFLLPEIVCGQSKVITNRSARIFYDISDSIERKYIFNDTFFLKGTITTTNKRGVLISIVSYSDIRTCTRNGLSLFYYPNGNLKRKHFYNENKIEGLVETWYPDGTLKRSDYFHNDSFTKGNCYTLNGRDTTHFPYEVKPVFIKMDLDTQSGLDCDFQDDKAVLIIYTVNLSGTVQDLKCYNFEKEFIADCDIKLQSTWIPGFIDGEPSDFICSTPIKSEE